MTALATEPRPDDTEGCLGRCALCRDPAWTQVDGHPMHICCDYWAQRGHSRCPACAASKAAERRTRPREKANA